MDCVTPSRRHIISTRPNLLWLYSISDISYDSSNTREASHTALIAGQAYSDRVMYWRLNAWQLYSLHYCSRVVHPLKVGTPREVRLACFSSSSLLRGRSKRVAVAGPHSVTRADSCIN